MANGPHCTGIRALLRLAPRARRRAALALFLGIFAPAAALAFERVSVPAGDTILDAALYRPPGPGPFPAVVALHGCGGLWNKHGAPSTRHADWAEQLSARGFIVLLPDSFGSRGLGSQCGVTERSVRAARERVQDAVSAKIWLQKRADVKADAVSLLGWSHGGTSVLATVRIDSAAQDGQPNFARAVAFYPGCRRALESNRFRIGVPTLILIGDADDWTPPGPCEGLSIAARGRGEALDIVIYPGALHDFDHPSLEPKERQGIANSASGSGTAHVGTNPEARADALTRVPAFLAR